MKTVRPGRASSIHVPAEHLGGWGSRRVGSHVLLQAAGFPDNEAEDRQNGGLGKRAGVRVRYISEHLALPGRGADRQSGGAFRLRDSADDQRTDVLPEYEL